MAWLAHCLSASLAWATQPTCSGASTGELLYLFSSRAAAGHSPLLMEPCINGNSLAHQQQVLLSMAALDDTSTLALTCSDKAFSSKWLPCWLHEAAV